MKWVILNICVIFSLFFSLNLPVSASPEFQKATGWEITGQIGGPSQGVAIQDNYAYIGVGTRLVVLDISNPANPIKVGNTAALDDLVMDVAVGGTHAYVAAGEAGLQIVDITNPLNPQISGIWNSPGFAESVTVSGSIAYLADGPYGLRVLDVSNPDNPVEMAHAFDMNYAYAVAVNGRYAYIAAAGAGLLVVDITNPQYPLEAGTYDTPGNARGVMVSVGRVYLADERSGLQIFSAADPLHLVHLGSLQSTGWAFDVTIAGSLAYVASAFGGLRVVNISNPASPVEVGSQAWLQSNITNVVVAGSQAFLTDRKNGFRVINIADPAHPAQVGYWNGFSFSHAVATAGNYAYVAAGFNGIRVINLSNPANPVEVSSFQINGLFYYLKLSGNRLYAGTMINSPARGIYVFDISDPARLQQIGYYQDIAECWGIEATGNTIYVADANDLKVFNFSNPPTLSLVGSYPLTPRGLTVRDGLAYVSQEYDGVKIYNVSNPASINLVGSYASSNSFTNGPVALSGNYAYVSDLRGLRILNISNPANPTEVSFTPTRDETHWLVFNNNRVYISEGSYGFSVYDVSNPSAPQLLNQTSVVGAVQVPALNNERLFIASGEGGLQIFTESAMSPTLPDSAAIEAEPILPRIQPGHQNLPDSLFAIREAASVQAESDVKATCTVSSTANSGANTLRACLKSQAAGNLIIFNPTIFPPTAPATIRIGPEQLPWITRDNITIDASNAGVILNGSNVTGQWNTGIGINSNNNTVRGLQIINFPMGINILGHYNLIGGSRLVGSGLTGQGNVISGSQTDGIGIYLGAHDNRILGNLVGLNAAGTVANPNHWAGIGINQSPANTIGSLNPGEDNIISANYNEGIILYGYDTLNTRVIGNKIGTDITGNLKLGNNNVGLYVESGAANTLVHGNLISGNGVAEVYVWDFGTDFNVFTGNFIGTNLAGTAPLPNLTDTGIATGNAAYTRIGGTAPGEGNVVANPNGVWVDAPFGANTIISGNHLGVNAAGTAVLPGAGGLRLNGASRSIVGGASQTETNCITREGNFSLELRSSNNVIAGNRMGLATDGVTALATAGFQIMSNREGNMIQGNQLANATSAGIWLDGAQNITIRRNLIWANPFKGIYLDSNANHNLPAPVLTLSATGGSGTTCPGCTVELFLDEGNQGRFYLGSVAADGSGDFSFPPHCPLPYPNLTATATDLLGNTSEFSDGHPVNWDCSSARPAPTLVSLTPNSGTFFAPTFLLTLTGSGFYADTVVRWNGTALPTTVLSSTRAQAVIPGTLFANGGELPVTVFTATPGGGESGTLVFSIPVPMQVFLPMVLRQN